jgi:hypothetical protein
MITKERLEKALKRLRNDGHYYAQSKQNMEELHNEIKELEEDLSALKSFSSALETQINEKLKNI